MNLLGIHHLTAISADINRNHHFYTSTLGMRLVKKTVNQDDTSAYHLFYSDAVGSPGNDLTFFDFAMPPETRGTHSITRTGLRVAGEASLKFWRDRLGTGEITERDGRQVLDFEDPEGQRLTLVADPSAGAGHPWDKSPVPAEHQIRGLGPITISVPNLKSTALMLTHVMNMRQVREYKNTHPVHVFEMGESPGLVPGSELHVAVEPGQPFARQGAGGVHHVAFRVPNETEYHAWAQRLNDLGIRNSGEVDRFYFRSLYFREPNGILFELATDGPGFASDEPLETMGQKLALPPFLEHQRNDIEANLKPLE